MSVAGGFRRVHIAESSPSRPVEVADCHHDTPSHSAGLRPNRAAPSFANRRMSATASASADTPAAVMRYGRRRTPVLGARSGPRAALSRREALWGRLLVEYEHGTS